MDQWLALLSAFGVGSLVTAVAQWFFNGRLAKQERRYAERKEAYVGLFESLRNQEQLSFADGTDLDVGHWVLRAHFVASPSVEAALNEWENTDPGSPKRIEATKALKAKMREDLTAF
jgi:hypothetical protein